MLFFVVTQYQQILFSNYLIVLTRFRARKTVIVMVSGGLTAGGSLSPILTAVVRISAGTERIMLPRNYHTEYLRILN